MTAESTPEAARGTEAAAEAIAEPAEPAGDGGGAAAAADDASGASARAAGAPPPAPPAAVGTGGPTGFGEGFAPQAKQPAPQALCSGGETSNTTTWPRVMGMS